MRGRYMNKKVLLGVIASAFVTSCLSADVYVGVDYGRADETFRDNVSSAEYKEKYADIKLKIGIGKNGGGKFQVTYTKSKYNSSHLNHTVIGVDMIGEVKINNEFYPFYKFGAGYGSHDNNGDYSNITYSGGLGLSSMISRSIFLILGVDWIGRSYSHDNSDVTISSNSVKPYIGLNYNFH